MKIRAVFFWLLVVISSLTFIVLYYHFNASTPSHVKLEFAEENVASDEKSAAHGVTLVANDVNKAAEGDDNNNNYAEHLLDEKQAPATAENRLVDVVVRKKQRGAIVYSCNKITICGGLADRQKGIVSAYVLSELTNRDFKLDMPRPCDISIFLAPNQVDWVLSEDEVNASSRSDIEGIDSHGYDLIKRIMSQEDLHIPEFDAEYVFVTWNMELVQFLRKHPLAANFSWLAPEMSLAEVYRYVLTKLFHPALNIRIKMEEMKRSIPPGTKLACAQIRLGFSKDFNDTESFNSLQGVEIIISFLRQYNDSSRYRIMFASDNVEALKMGRDQFPGIFLESSGPITHVDITEGEGACAGFGRAILDQMTLSTCDVLIISESGLGKIAAFLRNTDKELYLFYDSKLSIYRRDLRFPNRFYW